MSQDSQKYNIASEEFRSDPSLVIDKNLIFKIWKSQVDRLLCTAKQKAWSESELEKRFRGR